MSYSYSQERLDSKHLFDSTTAAKGILIKVAECLADTKHNQFLVDFDFAPFRQRLTQQMIGLIDSENHLNNSINASIKTEEKIKQLAKELESSENTANIDCDINEVFSQNLAQICDQNNPKTEDNERYKQLIEILNELSNDLQQNDDSNDELMALETPADRIPTDPFSKKDIENPVKNKKCGHIYDKEQLRLVLEARANTSSRLRCPNVGCDNRNVTMDDVVDDRRTKAFIDNLKRTLNL